METQTDFCRLNGSAVGGLRRWFLMKQDLTHEPSNECYIVEMDGIAKANYRIFVKALKASLQLKQEFPNSSVKLRDADKVLSLRAH
jgi:hypothetical protein